MVAAVARPYPRVIHDNHWSQDQSFLSFFFPLFVLSPAQYKIIVYVFFISRFFAKLYMWARSPLYDYDDLSV